MEDYKRDKNYTVGNFAKDYGALILAVVSMTIAGMMAYASLNAQTQTNTGDIQNLKTEYQSVSQSQTTIEVQLSQIQTDIQWLKTRPIFK